MIRATKTIRTRSSKRLRNQNPKNVTAAHFAKLPSTSRSPSSARSASDGEPERERQQAAGAGERQHDQVEQEDRREEHEREQRDVPPRRERRDRVDRVVVRRQGPRRARRTRGRAGGSVRGQLCPPGAEHLEGVPERGLRRLLVERGVDVRARRAPRRSGVNGCSSPSVASTGCASGNSSSLRNATASSPMHDDELRLDDVQLAGQPALRLLVGRALRELDAVRPVDRHRVDAQPLERLQDRLPRPAVEGDPLL